jgi:hypothetical protein
MTQLTSRISKVGALIQDSRRLIEIWDVTSGQTFIDNITNPGWWQNTTEIPGSGYQCYFTA